MGAVESMGVDYELRQALLGHRMLGMTTDYSHEGPEWDARLRDAVTRLEKGYALIDGLVDERPAAKVVGANYVNIVVSRLGLEPRTLALKGRCSTN